MFDPDTLYTPDDLVARKVATYSTLSTWRHERKGPAFIRAGKRVLYAGKDLNYWISEQRVEPIEGRPETAAA